MNVHSNTTQPAAGPAPAGEAPAPAAADAALLPALGMLPPVPFAQWLGPDAALPADADEPAADAPAEPGEPAVAAEPGALRQDDALMAALAMPQASLPAAPQQAAQPAPPQAMDLAASRPGGTAEALLAATAPAMPQAAAVPDLPAAAAAVPAQATFALPAAAAAAGPADGAAAEARASFAAAPTAAPSAAPTAPTAPPAAAPAAATAAAPAMASATGERSQEVAADAPAPGASGWNAAAPAPAAAQRPAATVALAGPPTAWRQALHEALGERLRVSVGNNMEQAVIRLDPPNLGRVEIAIRHSAGALEVSLTATHSEVVRQLHSVSDNLRNDLAGRQYTEVAVTVSQAPRAAQQGQPSFADGQGRQRQDGRQQDDAGVGNGLADAGEASSTFSLNGRE